MSGDMSLLFPLPRLADPDAIDPADEAANAAANRAFDATEFVNEEGSRRRRGPTAEELLDGLNESQRRAVTYEGPALLVVAGAGSGKTRVLTRRIAWLVGQRDVHPGSVLAITFTNKAAAEMRERVSELIGGRAKIMWVSTFHSSCVRILRREIARLGFGSNFSIYDDADSRRLMTLVCRDLDLDAKRYARGPPSTGSATARTSCSTLSRRPARPRTTSSAPSRSATSPTRRGCARPTPSTSTT